MTRKSDSDKMLSRYSQGKNAADSRPFAAAPKMGGVNRTSNQSSVTNLFLVQMGALLSDFSSLTHVTYAEVCAELGISPQTYAKV